MSILCMNIHELAETPAVLPLTDAQLYGYSSLDLQLVILLCRSVNYILQGKNNVSRRCCM